MNTLLLTEKRVLFTSNLHFRETPIIRRLDGEGPYRVKKTDTIPIRRQEVRGKFFKKINYFF